jgi:hypothetical protein
MDQNEHCVDCKYCNVMSKDQGVCRFNPPQLVGVMTDKGLNMGAGFPAVTLDRDYCGQYQKMPIIVMPSLKSFKP